MRDELLTIGKLAALLQLHPDTIGKYERKGLIPVARRSPMNGYRLWAEEDVDEIRQAVFGLIQASKGTAEKDV